MKFLLSALSCLLLASLHAPAQDVTTGLISRFPLTEISGLSAAETVSAKNGTLTGGVTWLDPGALFDGIQQIDTPLTTANGITTALTVAAWVRRDTSQYFHYILSKGSAFDLFYLNSPLYVSFNAGGGTAPDLSGATGGAHWRTDIQLPLGQWVHISYTYDGTSIRLYVDGAPAGIQTSRAGGSNNSGITYTSPVIGNTTQGLTLGNNPLYPDLGWHGALRDVRIYNRALSPADINKLSSLLSPAYTGLWLGRASLNEVREASSGTWSAAPPFSEQLLLHITEENMLLLKEATLMRSRVSAPALPLEVVVTQPSLIPNFDGITLRGGRLIGQRFSSATLILPPEGGSISKAGDFYQCVSNIAASDPVNPFRHKYHPDLGTGRSLSRTISFSLPPADSPSDHTITGILTESIGGLNKTTLEARGPITFTRVSTSGKLNQP